MGFFLPLSFRDFLDFFLQRLFPLSLHGWATQPCGGLAFSLLIPGKRWLTVRKQLGLPTSPNTL